MSDSVATVVDEQQRILPACCVYCGYCSRPAVSVSSTHSDFRFQTTQLLQSKIKAHFQAFVQVTTLNLQLVSFNTPPHKAATMTEPAALILAEL